MPAPATVPEFLELVRKSQLLVDSKLDQLIDRHRALGTLPNSIDQVANILVREAQLTCFQAKQLKLGRYKRFTIGSKYRLLELIGAGGMGAVYLCEHTLMRRLVALKVLPVEKLEDESNKERFYREARAVAALDHPNIVRAYDIDTFEKLHFLVMEYVDGTSLQEVVARYILEKKHFDPLRAAHYIAQAAVGMQHAHELGMVHRDIKPGNLLLDRWGVIKVLDMGLARFFNKQQDSVTEKYDHNCVLGTADYLAPEQAVSNMVDIRADIYALGGTFYFMLTGQTPFPDGTIAAKLVAHQTRDPREVESFRSDVPHGLLSVLRTMMAKNPADRYQSPMEVADALSEWAEQPITPPPSREMPIHCPLVQALAGPGLTANSGSSPLIRALFGSGRGAFSRGAGGSSIRSTSKLYAEGTAGIAGNGSGSDLNNPRSDTKVPLGGPVSTARASVAPTAPLQSPGQQLRDRSLLAQTSSELAPLQSSHRRIGIYILAGSLVGSLFVFAAMAAYYVGRNAKNDTPTTIPGIASDNLVPGPADKIFSPIQAIEKVGQIQTVEFKVASTTGQNTLSLNPEKETSGSASFSIRISSDFFQPEANHHNRLHEPTRISYQGKMIRARGMIVRDEATHEIYLDVRAPKQIVEVSDH